MSDAGNTHATVEALARLEPLKEVPESALRELLQLTTVEQFAPNQPVFTQGDPLSDYAWLLISGRMSVRVTSGAQQRVMADVWPGEIVGEAALYARGRARSATVVTTLPSAALKIPRSALLDRDDQPALIALEVHLLETMAKRLRSTNTTLQRVVAEQKNAAATASKGAPPAKSSTAPAKAASTAPGSGGPTTTRPPRPAPPERLTLAQRLARWFNTAD